MNDADLRVFVEVAQHLSFARVAAMREVHPSLISRSVGALEAELGVRLLHRTTRRVSLTEAGAAFLSRAAHLIEELDEAVDETRNLSRGVKGTLRLSASVAYGERRIVPLLAEFSRTYPDVSVDLILSDANLDLIAESIDLAVRLGPGVAGDYIVSRLADTRYRVCASPDYLAAADPIEGPLDAGQHPCVLFTLPAFRSSWRFMAADGAIAEVPVQGRIAISSALGLRTAALGGLGLALLPDWLVDDDLAAGRLIDVFPGYRVTATSFDTAAWLVYPSRSFTPGKVRAAIDFLRGTVGRHSAALTNRA